MTYEEDGSVDCEFHDWDGCSFDEFDLFEAGIVFESLLKPFQSKPYFLIFRYVFYPLKDGLVDCNVNVTIFDSNSIRTTAKQFNWNRIML